MVLAIAPNFSVWLAWGIVGRGALESSRGVIREQQLVFEPGKGVFEAKKVGFRLPLK